MNKCNRDCKRTGQGLNLRHCLLNIPKTQCGEPVTDNCNNICGFIGQQACERGKDATTVGALVIGSLDEASPSLRGEASYRFSVGIPEPPPAPGYVKKAGTPDIRPKDNALYLDFMQQGMPIPVPGEEGKVRPAAILKMEYLKEESTKREVYGMTSDFASADASTKAEAANIRPKEGIDFKTPSDTTREGDTPHTLRVGMYGEFTGAYIKVGQGHEERSEMSEVQEDAINILTGTHIFNSLDGKSVYGWGTWNPHLQRIPWTQRHKNLRLDDAGVGAFTIMALMMFPVYILEMRTTVLRGTQIWATLLRGQTANCICRLYLSTTHT